MKQFFKFFLASVLGVFAAFGLMFLFFAILGGIMAATETGVESKSVLELDFSTPIPELTGNVESSTFSPSSGSGLGLNKMTNLINHASTNKKIEGILINTTGVSTGQASIATLRDALEEFKESGKFVYAYGDMYTQSSYYLASVADSIFLNPSGMIDIKGFATMIPFYKNGLDKLGVKMNVFYAGDFKSATEPYRNTEMSESNKLQTRQFLESMVEHYKDEVAASRGMTNEKLDNIMTEYKGRSSASCLESGLIDRVAYWDELESSIKSKIGLADKKKIKYVSLDGYNKNVKLKKNTSAKGKIAVVYAEGLVAYGTNENGNITDVKYRKVLEKIEKDKNIDAVVLRVNSGGGSALTSDIIWRGIEKIKATGKPVVASFGDYAASGGYYIAAGADTIVSAPNTLTGSIGVFMMLPNMQELLNEKLGITFDDVRTHPLAINLTVVSEQTEAEKEILQEATDHIYQTFLKRVADGREMSIEDVHEVAQGRVWTGTKAKELGLVDAIGGLEEALEIAGEMAGLTEYRLKTYPEIEESFLDQMIKEFANSEDFASANVLDPSTLQILKEYESIKHLVSDNTVQARLPYRFKFD